MNEEISLRDIIHIIMKQKWIIIIVTIAAMLLTGLINFFYLQPTYETFSIVRMENAYPNQATVPLDIRQYQESLRSSSTINGLIEKNGLNRAEYTIDSIRGMFRLEAVQNSNILKIIVRGNDAEKISKMANMLAFELAIRIEITDRTKTVVESQTKLVSINEQIEIVKAQIAETENLLSTTPEKITTSQALTENELLRNIVQERTNADASTAAKIQMQSEWPNPVYTELQTKMVQTKIQLNTLESEKKELADKIASNLNRIDEIESKGASDILNINKSIRIFSGSNAIFINPSIQPEAPVGPNKLLNIVLSGIVGIMISLFIVFVRHYLKVTPRSGVDV